TPRESKITIPVFDDGLHADGAADDGISVGGVVADGPDGFYELGARAKCPDGVEYTATSNFEVQAKNDLLIADSIQVVPANPTVREPVALTATVMNDGTVDSKAVELEFYVDHKKISSKTFDLNAGESKVVTTTWTPPASANYDVMLTINPDLEPYASNF